MSGISNYDELKSSVIDWIDSSELNERVEDFISLAEARHKREVRIRAMLKRCSVGVVQRYVDLPSDYLDGKTFRLLTTPRVELEEVSMKVLNSYWREGPGQPKFFTVHAEIELDVEPETSYAAEMIYYRAVTPLSDTVATNSLLKLAPDVYLYGALAAAAPFLQDDERVQLWEGLYTSARNATNRMEQKTFGTPIARVPGVRP